MSKPCSTLGGTSIGSIGCWFTAANTGDDRLKPARINVNRRIVTPPHPIVLVPRQYEWLQNPNKRTDTRERRFVLHNAPHIPPPPRQRALRRPRLVRRNAAPAR